jgi:hypothetical protein
MQIGARHPLFVLVSRPPTTLRRTSMNRPASSMSPTGWRAVPRAASLFSQLIEWHYGKHTIRLGYYRKRPGERHWEFGSRT